MAKFDTVISGRKFRVYDEGEVYSWEDGEITPTQKANLRREFREAFIDNKPYSLHKVWDIFKDEVPLDI